MKISIITVSNSEIVSSEKNNNIKLIASQLYKNGFDVVLNTTLINKSEIVLETLKQAINLSDCIVFVSDNDFEKCYMCKKIICEAFNTKLVNSQFAKKNIEDYSKNLNVPLKKEDATYYQMPEIARCIKNPSSAFQGFLIDNNEKLLFFLPLVSNELMHMFFTSALPYLLQKSSGKVNTSYVFKTFGIKGSEMVLLLKDLIKNKHNINIICNEYLLNGEVLISFGSSTRKDIAMNIISSVYTKILPYIYSDNDNSMSEMLFELLSITHKKLVFAEDFTAGKMVNTIYSELKNASEVLGEAYFCPTPESKSKILGVDKSLFRQNGSLDEVVYQMALGALENSGADIVVANSGDINSGEVVFAIGSSEGIHIFNQKVEGSFEQKINMASNAIFFRLIKKLKQNDFHLGQSTV